MKELRGRTASAVLRIAFAFDPLQHAIVLAGGDKSGVSEKMFYKRLIEKADHLYAAHLLNVQEVKRQQAGKSQISKDKRRKGKGR